MWVKPQDYFFFSPHEGQLAGEVWDISETQRKTGAWVLSFPHNILSWVPAFMFFAPMRRILYARDFITTQRTYGTVNAYTQAKYSLGEIANV